MMQSIINTGYESLLTALAEKNALMTKDLSQAKRFLQENSAQLLGTLLSLGWVSERDMAETIVQNSDYMLAKEADYPLAPSEHLPISLRFMQQHGLISHQTADGDIYLIMSDPFNLKVVQALTFLFDDLPTIKVGLPSLITQSIERVYMGGDENEVNDNTIDDESIEDDIEQLKDLASEAPVIQLVNKIVQKAVETGSSDIHIEPFEKLLKIRYRIDGLLVTEEAALQYSSAAVISRVKIMAKLDIAERRLPQDGRIMVRSLGKVLDIRVSTLPTVHGESVVMRLLDRESLQLDFDTLGFTPSILNNFMDVLSLPHGIILVTGPTGSGKSTTLYTALTHLNDPSVKIITVEDPVEYQLEGINQLPVKAHIGLDFATALRSIVRQDPDIIMIGEMRDVETAKIAIQSALTGHLVLSTLHTNSASAGITRLQDMGVENFLLTSTVNGILGQRLVRKLCSECREAYIPGTEQKKLIESTLGIASPRLLYRAGQCKSCGHTGYRGRTMLVEWLPMSNSIQSLVINNANASTLQQKAVDEGMTTLFQDGINKVVNGVTSIDEVLRVTQQGT